MSSHPSEPGTFVGTFPYGGLGDRAGEGEPSPEGRDGHLVPQPPGHTLLPTPSQVVHVGQAPPWLPASIARRGPEPDAQALPPDGWSPTATPVSGHRGAPGCSPGTPPLPRLRKHGSGERPGRRRVGSQALRTGGPTCPSNMMPAVFLQFVFHRGSKVFN